MLPISPRDLQQSVLCQRLQGTAGLFKAEVYVLRLPSGEKIVCKDFRRFQKHYFARPIAALLVRRESQMMAKLNHWPFSPKLYQSPDRLLLIQEYIDGDAINKAHINDARSVWKTLFSTLIALHQQGITHNDIRATNILLKKDQTPVFIDFTSAYVLPKRAFLGKVQRSLRFFDLRHLLKLKRSLKLPMSQRERKMLARPAYQQKLMHFWKKSLLPSLKQKPSKAGRIVIALELLALIFVYAHTIR